MDSLSPERLADLLTQRLRGNEPLPRSRLTPDLSYGRHQGPVPAHRRLAAVAVALYRDSNLGWVLPLTLRPDTLQHHAGQVCLPGGQIEPREDAYQASIREFKEELGVTPVVTRCCGELSTQYVYASGNLVHPVVMIIQPPDRPWTPDPLEVHEVISLPLDVVCDPAHRRRMVKQKAVTLRTQQTDQLEFHAGTIEYQGHLVWGATALILDQLAQILQVNA